MKSSNKILAGLFLFGIAACAFLLSPSQRSHAWPISIGYQVITDTINVNSIIISTNGFPGANANINNNVINDQWCITHLAVSSPFSTFGSVVTIAWATSTALSPSTTDFYVVTHSSGIPYDTQWGLPSPYCAPVGQSVVKVNSSVSGSTITLEGFLFKGWSP